MDSLYDLKKTICIELVHILEFVLQKEHLGHFAVAGIYSSGYVYIWIDLLWCLVKDLFKLFMSKPNSTLEKYL